MGHIPVGMEMFSAADEEQWKIITRQIDESDYYALVVAHRYGSTTPEGVSFTEKEFDYAASKGVPILAFVIDESAPWPADKHESDAKLKRRLIDFKKKVKARLIQFWKNKEELHGRFSIALMKAITAYPRVGWARADEVSGPGVMKELARLSSENAKLRGENDELKAKRPQETDEVRNIIRIMFNNTRKFGVRQTSKWEEAEKHTPTLAELFSLTAPNLLSENTNAGVAANIALGLVGTKYHKDWPVGRNVVSEVLADFAALDLVEPSKKKHSVSDKEAYWTLTKLGQKVLTAFRRVSLEEGLSPEAEVSAENG